MCIENTLGSYKPHFWAGERWEHVRDFAGSGLRTALDRFADALFWEGLAYMAYKTFWQDLLAPGSP
ncbi:hypothetical protein ABZ837_25235 [Streptomyces sp. NPDC047197]|uniref:hypothetical protein n=1 Tax=Streptomyces sp. NPDC047197 TaxID=3155477 RepID=UPI0033DB5202